MGQDIRETVEGGTTPDNGCDSGDPTGPNITLAAASSGGAGLHKAATIPKGGDGLHNVARVARGAHGQVEEAVQCDLRVHKGVPILSWMGGSEPPSVATGGAADRRGSQTRIRCG